MMIKERQNWIKLFKALTKISSKDQAETWLEKEALILKKRNGNEGLTLTGAKYLIKVNMAVLTDYLGKKDKIKKLIGLTSY